MRGEDGRQGQQRLWISTTRWALLVALLGLVVILLDYHPLAARLAPHPSAAATKGGPSPSTTMPATSSEVADGSMPRPTSSSRPSVQPTSANNATLSATPTTAPANYTPISASPIQAQVETGWLDAPLSISATYDFQAPSPRTVVATWSGAPSLSLTLTCDGATTSTSGGSGLTLSAHGASCSLTLAGPADVATTSYTITIGAT